MSKGPDWLLDRVCSGSSSTEERTVLKADYHRLETVNGELQQALDRLASAAEDVVKNYKEHGDPAEGLNVLDLQRREAHAVMEKTSLAKNRSHCLCPACGKPVLRVTPGWGHHGPHETYECIDNVTHRGPWHMSIESPALKKMRKGKA
jgi:hypothetical protein